MKVLRNEINSTLPPIIVQFSILRLGFHSPWLIVIVSCGNTGQLYRNLNDESTYLKKHIAFRIQPFTPFSPPSLDDTNREKTLKWICWASSFHFRLCKKMFFLNHCIFFQLSKSYKCEKKNRTSFIYGPKSFSYILHYIPSLWRQSLRTSLGWGEIEALRLFYYGRRDNRRRFNKAGLNSPPVTDIRSRKRLHLRWWLLTPHLTRKKKLPQQQPLLLAIVRMQRTTKSWSKTLLVVWWRMRDTGKCLYTFFWRHQSQ